jgi:hypothetical protein
MIGQFFASYLALPDNDVAGMAWMLRKQAMLTSGDTYVLALGRTAPSARIAARAALKSGG